MAQKTIVFDFSLSKEKHPVILSECPAGCKEAKLLVAELPLIAPACLACREVVLRIKDSAYVLQDCTSATQKGIKAVVTERLQLVDSSGCPISKYRFTATYEDAQLVNPEIPLLACDIDGFDCYTYADDYILKLLQCSIANVQDLRITAITPTATSGTDGIYVVTVSDGVNTTNFNADLSLLLDDTTVTYTLAPTGLAAPTSITLTGSDGNNSIVDLCPVIRQCLIAGAGINYDPNTGTISAVPTTPDVFVFNPLTGAGSHTAIDGGATVNFNTVSADAGNIVTVGANGGANLTCVDVNACVVAPAQTPVTVVDTNTVDLTASGVDNHTLQADVIVSPDVGNQIVVNANGLFVPASAGGITVADTNCIDLTLTGTVLTAAPIMSATLGNAITCSADGLLVPRGAGLTVTDNACLDLTVANGNLTVAPIISPTIGNRLTCSANGLLATQTTTTLADTGTNTAAGSNILRYTNEAGVLTDFCEGFATVRASEVCATPGVGTLKAVRGVTVVDKELVIDSSEVGRILTAQDSASNNPAINITAVGSYAGTVTAEITMTNPSTCKNMSVQVAVDYVVSSLLLRAGWEGFIQAERNINGGGFVLAHQDRFTNTGGVPYNGSIVPFHRHFTLVLAPGGTFTYEIRSRIQTVIAGGGAGNSTWGTNLLGISAYGWILY